MGLRSERILVTTDSDGDATSYTDQITGKLLNVHYTKTDYASGVDFAITVDDTGQGIWTQANQNATASKAPLQPMHDNVGAADTDQMDHIYLLNHKIKIVIDEGGDTKVGTFDFIYED
jgi:hypothetical protein